MNMQESSVVLNACEKILGSICIALMTFVVCDEKKLFSIRDTHELLFFVISMGILLLNFFGWFYIFRVIRVYL